METKHTPGPWKLIEQGDANMYGMVTAGNRWIINFQQNGELMSETELANARLMAAAPELLEALISAKNLIGSFRLKKDPPSQQVWEQIESVIKKATENPVP